MFRIYWFLPAISGLLLAVSIEYSFLGWLSLVGVLPLLVFIEYCPNKKSAFFGGWLAGLIFFSLTIRWLLSTFSFNWVGVPSSASVVPVVVFVWLLLSLTLGISFGVFTFLTFRLRTKTAFDLIIVPSLWILAEYLKAWIFILISWGPGGSLAPYWTMANLGYALTDTPFIFWSRFAGIYGVSFLAVFINAAIFFLLKNIRLARIRIKTIAVLSVIFLSLMLLPAWLFSVQPEKNSLRVALLQTNSPFGFLSPQAPVSLWEEFKKTEKNSIQPDLVIFPEGSRLLAFNDNESKLLLRHLFPDENKPGLIVTSAVGTSSINSYASSEKIIYRNQKGELVDVQEKTFLIPAGEFLPIIVKMFVDLKGDPVITERFKETRALIPGDMSEHPVSFGSTKIGTLLCSGVLSSSLYRSIVKEGAEILINSASLAIFNANPLFFSQIKNMARFQAIANSRPFLQSANAGPTFYINENGKIITETKSPEAQFVLVNVAPVKTKTAFSKLGDWPLVAALALVFSLFIRNRRSLTSGPRSPTYQCKRQGNLLHRSSLCSSNKASGS